MWAVTATQVQISGNRRKDGVTGLGPFPSSISPSYRDWSYVLSLKYCALFEFQLVVSFNLFCTVLLYHLVLPLYSFPPGLWVTKAMNCMSFMQQHLWACPCHPEQPCAAQPLSSHPSTDASHQLTSWQLNLLFHIACQISFLNGFLKTLSATRTARALSHQSLEQRGVLFPLHSRTRLWLLMAQQNLLYNSVLTFHRWLELAMLSTLYLF